VFHKVNDPTSIQLLFYLEILGVECAEFALEFRYLATCGFLLYIKIGTSPTVHADYALLKAPHYSVLLVASSVDSTYPGVIPRLYVSSTRQRGNDLRAAATHAKAHKNVVEIFCCWPWWKPRRLPPEEVSQKKLQWRSLNNIHQYNILQHWIRFWLINVAKITTMRWWISKSDENSTIGGPLSRSHGFIKLQKMITEYFVVWTTWQENSVFALSAIVGKNGEWPRYCKSCWGMLRSHVELRRNPTNSTAGTNCYLNLT
jgi:hypothetical protein